MSVLVVEIVSGKKADDWSCGPCAKMCLRSCTCIITQIHLCAVNKPSCYWPTHFFIYSLGKLRKLRSAQLSLFNQHFTNGSGWWRSVRLFQNANACRLLTFAFQNLIKVYICIDNVLSNVCWSSALAVYQFVAQMYFSNLVDLPRRITSSSFLLISTLSNFWIGW